MGWDVDRGQGVVSSTSKYVKFLPPEARRSLVSMLNRSATFWLYVGKGSRDRSKHQARMFQFLYSFPLEHLFQEPTFVIK